MKKKPSIEEITSLTLKLLIAKNRGSEGPFFAPGSVDQCVKEARLQLAQVSSKPDLLGESLSRGEPLLKKIVLFLKQLI